MIKRSMNLPGYYDEYNADQDNINQASFTQNEYYSRRLTDLTNVLYVNTQRISCFFVVVLLNL